MEESISSKKKEKRKHVDHVESSVFVTPGAVRSSDDLEDDTGDYRVLSRYVMMPLPSSRPGDPARGSPLSGSDVRGGGEGGRRGGTDSKRIADSYKIHLASWSSARLRNTASFSSSNLGSLTHLAVTRPADKQHNEKPQSLPSVLTPSTLGWKLAASGEVAGPWVGVGCEEQHLGVPAGPPSASVTARGAG